MARPPARQSLSDRKAEQERQQAAAMEEIALTARRRREKSAKLRALRLKKEREEAAR